MKVRLGEIQDAEAITAVINAAFRLAESFLMDRDRIDVDSVQSLIQAGRFLVADHAGVLVGCVYVELKGERAYLGLLSVHPERQKTGLGSTLMNAAEAYCAKAGCRFMDLRIVNLRQELPDFYRRRGYVETGVEPFTPGLTPKLPCHFVKISKSLR
ncbi:MAG TPA: GNAT family N-acetyltransferase [Candidatus Sulfotelmatobacter sp.]|jgi:GNAT superfamily N-acetyltransferase|nr:GNAT family N-acetyltransferase [Candidatus Sulfotelmatobacter sp.]